MKTLLINTALKLVGGIPGLVTYALEWFNKRVLAKITDKEEFAAYAEDVAAFAFFLDGTMNRHGKWLSEAKRKALAATIAAVNDLAVALKDTNITTEEFDLLVERVKAAIDAWVAA